MKDKELLSSVGTKMKNHPNEINRIFILPIKFDEYSLFFPGLNIQMWK